MKKILLSFAVCAATLFASCSKDTDTINTELTAPVQGSVVNLSFQSEAVSTRAFFEDMGTLQAWEKQINYVTVFVFDADGEIVTCEKFKDSEIAESKVSFVLPNISSGDRCYFYAIANQEVRADIATLTELRTELSSDIADYNGAFEQVTATALRADNFAMTGYDYITIANPDYANNLSIDMRRLVAKFAVETSLDPSFVEQFSGAIRVVNVNITDASSKSHMISLNSITATERDYNVSQTPREFDGEFRNLFYLFESYNDGPDITIDLIYDFDGDFSTTDDQTASSFTNYLPSDIDMNDYFRIKCVINGITDLDPVVSFKVLDWTNGGDIIIDEDVYVDIH